MGISPDQLRREVIRPALAVLDLHSDAAEALVLATAGVESNLTWLVQHGGGPARGLWQIEPATASDLFETYLAYRPDRAAAVRSLMLAGPGIGVADQLAGNLYLGAALCRLKYYRDPAPLPGLTDAGAMGRYWKRVYNTAGGAGTAAKFEAVYRDLIL